MAEAQPVAQEVKLEDPAERQQADLKIPKEVEKLLNNAIKRSVDKALQESGGKLSPPREQAIVERASRELTIEVQRTIHSSYEGPLPPPFMLAEFDRVVPGLAGQLVQMAQAEQRHRHRWENKALWNEIFLQSGGLILGCCLAGASVLGAFLLAMAGRTTAMGIMLGVPAIQMIRLIINNRRADGSNPRKPSPPIKTPPKKRR